MTARARVLSAAFLRAGLLAAVLAIVAGIFGMHVLTADHSSHAGAAAAAHPVGDAAVVHSVEHTAGHAGHREDGHTADAHAGAPHPAAPPDAGASFTASETCSSGCPGAQEAGASCIPLAKAASLAVTPPQAGPAAHSGPASHALSAAGYTYLPSGPTPCELSISRT